MGLYRYIQHALIMEAGPSGKWYCHTLAGRVGVTKGRCSGQMVSAGGNRMLLSCLLALGSVAVQIIVTSCGFSWQDQWLIDEPEEILSLGNISEFKWTPFILLGFRKVEEPINCEYFKREYIHMINVMKSDNIWVNYWAEYCGLAHCISFWKGQLWGFHWSWDLHNLNPHSAFLILVSAICSTREAGANPMQSTAGSLLKLAQGPSAHHWHTGRFWWRGAPHIYQGKAL